MRNPELSYQKELVDAVVANGGYGHKLSNRFVAGIADLLVKLPCRPGIVLECKWNKAPVRKAFVEAEPTPLQKQYLYAFQKAGMLAGIVSFVERGRDFGVRVSPIDFYCPLLSDHAWCRMGPGSRKDAMLSELERFLNAI